MTRAIDDLSPMTEGIIPIRVEERKQRLGKAGRLMAELVTGETPVVDPTPFRYSRFTDGSRPQPSPLA